MEGNEGPGALGSSLQPWMHLPSVSHEVMLHTSDMSCPCQILPILQDCDQMCFKPQSLEAVCYMAMDT